MNEQTSSDAVLQQFGQWLQNWADFTLAQAALTGSADPDNRVPDGGTADPPLHWLADRGEVEGPPEHWLALLREHSAEWLLDVAGERDDHTITGQEVEGEKPALLPPATWIPDMRQGFLYFLEVFGFAQPEETAGAEQREFTKEARTAEHPSPVRPQQMAADNAAQHEEPAPGEVDPVRQPFPARPPATAAPPDIIQTWRLPEQGTTPPFQPGPDSDKDTPGPVDQVEEMKFTAPEHDAEKPEEPGTTTRDAAPVKRPAPPTPLPLKPAKSSPIQPAEAATVPLSPANPPGAAESVEAKRPQPNGPNIPTAGRPAAPPAQPAAQAAAVRDEGQRQADHTPTPVTPLHPVKASQNKMDPPAVVGSKASPPVIPIPPLPPPPVPETSVQYAEQGKQKAVRPQEQKQEALEPVAPVEKGTATTDSPAIIQRKTAEPTITNPQPRRVTRIQLRYTPPQIPSQQERVPGFNAVTQAVQEPQAAQLPHVERPAKPVTAEIGPRIPQDSQTEKRTDRERAVQMKPGKRRGRPTSQQSSPPPSLPETAPQPFDNAGGKRPFWLWEIPGSERPQPAVTPEKEPNGTLEMRVREVSPFQNSGASAETQPPQPARQEPWPELPAPPKLTNPGRSRRHDSGRRRRLDGEQRGRRWNG